MSAKTNTQTFSIEEEKKKYEHFKSLGLSLNIARGKPAKEQLDLSNGIFEIFASLGTHCISESGSDIRNYGELSGIPEAKNVMSWLLNDDPTRIFVGGNSSLTLMYTTLAHYLDFGCLGSMPWGTLMQEGKKLKWLCSVPGYDRHFAITEAFGFEMIPVPIKNNDLDMDAIQNLVAEDECIKGMWCVPQYSNPAGYTLTDKTVDALAHMKCAANDFKIFWDNAYGVHHLYRQASKQGHVKDIGEACEEAGNASRYVKFASTSKVTFAGAGISALATSKNNLAEFQKHASIWTIGANKINQMAHALFFPNEESLCAHMQKHADILRPKFELVEQKLSEAFSGEESVEFSSPDGGYFISFTGHKNTAKRTVELARDAGLVLTAAGSTWPHKNDPQNNNIRIAPSYATLDELNTAMDLFVTCARIAAYEA